MTRAARHVDASVNVTGLIGSAYEAAGRPEVWTEVLTGLARACGATMAGLLTLDSTTNASSVRVSIGVDPRARADYDEYYGRINPVLREAERRGWTRPGFVRLSHEILPKSELARTEYFNDFLEPNGLGYGLGCTLIEEGTLHSTLTLQRPTRLGPFGQAEAAIVRELAPHLATALRLHDRLAREAAFSRAVAASLDALAVAAFLLDSRDRVIDTNRAAAALLEGAEVVALRGGSLRGASRRGEVALKRLLESCRRLARGGAGDPPDAVLLPRDGVGRPFQAVATPLHDSSAWLTPSAAAVVLFLVDLEHHQKPTAGRLRDLFGLTATEARLAGELAAGSTLAEAAVRLGISRETAKSHLARVFEKTDTRRQAELVSLLARVSIRLR